MRNQPRIFAGALAVFLLVGSAGVACAEQVPAGSGPAQTDTADSGEARLHYENPKSDTVKYSAPDPNGKPTELRLQYLERRVGEQEQELNEVEARLRDVITVLNNITNNNVTHR